METLKIDVLNPKAVQLLKDLADLDLIAIHENNDNDLMIALARLRRQASSAPSFDEITSEVELVRAKRYEQ
jgi:hypothetical protein